MVQPANKRLVTEAELAEQLAGLSGGTNVAASTTVSGIVELATPTETVTGTDAVRATTPAGVKAVADTKAALTHTHDDRYFTETEVTTALAGKAATSHTHAQSEVTGLSTALTAKADDSAVVHKTAAETIAGVKTFSDAPVVPNNSFAIAKVSGLQDALDSASGGGTVVVPATDTTAGIVELATSAETATGTDATRAVTPAGLKPLLDGKMTLPTDPNQDRISFWDDSVGLVAWLAVLAPLNIVGTTLQVSSATETAVGVVELATVSEATAGTDTVRAITAAGLKAVGDTKAPLSHTHSTSDVSGLDTALSGKANTTHTHTTGDVSGLDSALAGKAATSHTHAQTDITGLAASLSGKANTSHTHATSDVTGLDTALAGKASTVHTHATSDVTGLDTALANKVTGTVKITVGTTAPSSPAVNDLWVDIN